ncbi:PREDICTED: uncharacterized protein LOC105563580 [Vollenhovia emeryi]|uniref:uncharacterized protein LOC105563580 n=1 Tax=Vollenhovia emeryi TaxID=411798 RepID=UPI0005F55A3F|nr:PREDICTED: uncharacterized protein LOC105563580 [Vollenhovia emeryi]
MSLSQFEDLLALVAPYITKQTVTRDPIPAAARLSMTLRYLTSGDSMNSMSYQYLVGFTTVSNIIAETCAALWDCLAKEVLPFPLSKEDWLNIAQNFEDRWNFNHCIGAIDGKHIAIQCPHNAGSLYYNYKNYHSIVLLGICDANYMFTFVDIGAYGRRSDGGIFRDSIVGQKFYNKEMRLPEPEKLTVDGDPMPYVLVADEAFQLTDFLLRPYPGKGGLNHEKNIYNYRLSRARRTIENTFGILVSQWRILKKPIDATVKNTMQIVQAIICIHNWLRKQDLDKNEYISADMIDCDGPNSFIPGNWRKEMDSSHALTDLGNCGSNNSSRAAINIRNEFCDYFNGEGAIPWQYLRRQ